MTTDRTCLEPDNCPDDVTGMPCNACWTAVAAHVCTANPGPCLNAPCPLDAALGGPASYLTGYTERVDRPHPDSRCWTRPELDHGHCPSSTECTA